MGRANAVGVGLSMLTAVVWLITGMAHWPIWAGMVFSVVTAFYWAFGRRMFFPNDVPEERQRRSSR